MIPDTILKLETWMKENCYNFSSYSINGNSIYEGNGIEQSDGLFTWYYTERGEKKILRSFHSEKEIVEFAYNEVRADRWARTHCIGFTTDPAEINQLTAILTELKIEYINDEIPHFYGLNQPVYRTFVLGCDVSKTLHLRDQYFKDTYYKELQ